MEKKKDISIAMQIAKVNAELMHLEMKFKTQIRMEINSVNNSKKRKRDNLSAQSRLKNAYYCLQLTYVAMDRLEDISSTYHLTKSINELSSAMKLINRLEGKADHVNTLMLRFRTKKMLANAEVATTEGGMREYFKDPIDELVDDSVIEDLLSGKSLDDILYDDVDTADNIEDLFGFCSENSEELNAAGIKTSDNYEQSLQDLEDMISKL